MRWVRMIVFSLALAGAAMLIGCQANQSTADNAAMNGQTPEQCNRQKVY